MAKNKAGEPRDDEIPSVTRAGAPTIQDKIAAFDMLDEMDVAKKTQAEKTLRLSLVGFTNPEIANMLQTTPAVVSQNLYSMKRGGGKKGRRTSSTGNDDS